MPDLVRRSPRVGTSGLVALLAPLWLLAGCSGTDAATDGSGISREEYCSMGRPALERVAATRTGTAVRVTWQQTFVTLDPATFRVYRRAATDARWTRLGEVRLAPDVPRRYVDRSPTAGSPQYGVTEVALCGEGPLCSSTGAGRRCATTTVAARAD